MAAVRTWVVRTWRFALPGLLLTLLVGYAITTGGGPYDMVSRNTARLSMLRLQFTDYAGKQVELKRKASAKLTGLALATDPSDAYAQVQLVLAPVRSCPALEGAQIVYRLDNSLQQELARWIEINSVIPICLERNELDKAAAYYGWAEKSVAGLSRSYLRLPSQMASAFISRSFERDAGGDTRASEMDWLTARNYLASYEAFGDLAEKVAAQRPQYRKAQQSLLHSDLASDPANQVTRIYLAQAYNAASQGREALETITPLLQTMPDDTRVWQQYGQALISLNRIAEAEDALQRAVRLDPDDLQALNRLGVLYKETGQTAKAEALFRQALASPGGQDAYWVWEHLGDVLLDEGRRTEAAEAFAVAIARAPPELEASARKKLDEINQ